MRVKAMIAAAAVMVGIMGVITPATAKAAPQIALGSCYLGAEIQTYNYAYVGASIGSGGFVFANVSDPGPVASWDVCYDGSYWTFISEHTDANMYEHPEVTGLRYGEAQTMWPPTLPAIDAEFRIVCAPESGYVGLQSIQQGHYAAWEPTYPGVWQDLVHFAANTLTHSNTWFLIWTGTNDLSDQIEQSLGCDG